MKNRMSSAAKKDTGTVIHVWVQPNSPGNMFNGFKGDALKVKVTSSAIEGRANKACVNFLAEEFGVAKSNVEIIGGHKSRMKRVRVMGIPPHEMERIIQGKMGKK